MIRPRRRVRRPRRRCPNRYSPVRPVTHHPVTHHPPTGLRCPNRSRPPSARHPPGPPPPLLYRTRPGTLRAHRRHRRPPRRARRRPRSPRYHPRHRRSGGDHRLHTLGCTRATVATRRRCPRRRCRAPIASIARSVPSPRPPHPFAPPPRTQRRWRLTDPTTDDPTLSRILRPRHISRRAVTRRRLCTSR